MSKLSAVSRHVTGSRPTPSWSGVIVFSFLLAAMMLLQGCGNKGDLYRESDAAALDGLQEAADKLRSNPSEGEDEEDEEDNDEKKPGNNND